MGLQTQGAYGAITSDEDAEPGADGYSLTYTFGASGTSPSPKLKDGEVTYSYANDEGVWTCSVEGIDKQFVTRCDD